MPRPTDGVPAGRDVRVARTRLAGLAVFCARCTKRQGLRPGAVRRLLEEAGKRAARDLPRDARGKRRKLCIAESGCLGPCPKRAVAVATGASLAAGRVLLLDPAAGPEGALKAVLPEFGPNGGLGPRPGDPSPTA